MLFGAQFFQGIVLGFLLEYRQKIQQINNPICFVRKFDLSQIGDSSPDIYLLLIQNNHIYILINNKKGQYKMYTQKVIRDK